MTKNGDIALMQKEIDDLKDLLNDIVYEVHFETKEVPLLKRALDALGENPDWGDE